MPQKIQVRRGTAAEWTSANPVLADGEPGLEKDTKKIKYGDGVTAWNSLAYSSGSDAIYNRKVDVPPTVPNAMDDEFEGESLDAKWTILDQQTGDTIALDNGCLIMESPTGHAHRRFAIVQTTPSGSWKVRAKLAIESLIWNFYGIGLMVRCSSSDKWIWFGLMAHSSCGVLTGFGQANTGDSVAAEYDMCNYVSHECYLELEYDSVNTKMIWRISTTGNAYRLIREYPVADFLGVAPDQVGITTHPYDNTGYGWGGLMTCDWFRVTEP